MINKISEKLHLEHWQLVAGMLVIYDVITVIASYFLALMLRFDMRYSWIPKEYLSSYLKFAPMMAFITVTIYAVCKMYRSIWRFASFTELNRTALGVVISALVHNILIEAFVHPMPLSYAVFGVCFQFGFAIVIRFSYRAVTLLRNILNNNINNNNNNDNNNARAMIIGAGAAGTALLDDIVNSDEYEYKVVGFIDDNTNKLGRSIKGVTVVGTTDDILAKAEELKIKTIFIAIPSADPEAKRHIVNICRETTCELKILPGMYQYVRGEVKLADLKTVDIEDLLGRETIKVNNDDILAQLKDKVVLVTGGGGSIGSELCRQIAEHHPKQLIIFDIYENNAYDIQQELIEKYKGYLNLTVLIGSVRDKRRLLSIFREYKPDIVFHAAAHKHVPLMEDSPCEAIKNNVQGTYNTASAALKYKTKKFVLISTDKAVNPTNVMGASKRMCEMIIQTLNNQSEDTDFVAVRFGNVLGSNGSVIPLFKKQIKHGGPVTVTHPDIIRYFMTIPEAVSLVLQASYYAKGGEIFVLDMGEPMKIDTLARNLIKMSGLRPDVDIPIVYSGLRPGEKLYEEKLMDEEGLEKTDNNLIHIAHPLDFDFDTIIKQYETLLQSADYNKDQETKALLQQIVPTFHPAEN